MLFEGAEGFRGCACAVAGRGEKALLLVASTVESFYRQSLSTINFRFCDDFLAGKKKDCRKLSLPFQDGLNDFESPDFQRSH